MRTRHGEARGRGTAELLIAAAVLVGIAVATAPRWSSAAAPPERPPVKLQLEILRNAIERYAYDHAAWPAEKSDGMHPAETAEAFIAQLTQATDRDGVVGPHSERFCYGPYLSGGPPACPLMPEGQTPTVRVIADEMAPTFAPDVPSAHWVYNARTGQIVANSDAIDADGVRYDRY